MPEVVLIEFVGDSKSGVKAAQAQVAANREVEASAKKASAATGAAAAAATKRMEAAGASMSKVGKSMTKYISLPLLAIGGASAKMSLDFNRSMLEISTQAGGTRKEVEHLSKAVLDLTAKDRFAQGPQELSEALFHIESVGIRGAKALKTLKAASDLATVGNADLEATTNALVGAMRTGIKGAGNMREAIGILNATIGAGNLRMGELTEALGTGFLVSAKQVGLTLRDAGAALAELTSQGVPAAAAATRLRMTFTLMAAPTNKAKEALEGIGLNSESLAKQMRGPNGLVDAIALLRSHLEPLTKIERTQVLTEAFGGARSGTTIMALVGNLDDLSKKYKEVGKNAGDFGKKLKETAEDSAVQWQKSFAQLKGALIEIGNELVPIITPVLKDIASAITEMVHGFSALSPGMKSFIIDASLAAVAVGPLLTVASKLISVLLAIAAAPEAFAIGGAIVGLSLAFIELYKHSKAFHEEIDSIGHAVKSSFGEVKKEIGPTVQAFVRLGKVIGDVQTPLGSIGDILKGVFIKTFKVVFEQARNIVRGLGKTFAGELQVIRGIVNLISALLKGDLGGAWRAVKTIFKGGVKFITGILGTLTAQIRPILGALANVFTDLFTGIWDEVKDIFTDGINSVIGFINTLIDAINVIPGIPDIGKVGEIGGSGGKHGHPAGLQGPVGKARGGPILEGAPSGDTVPAMLERGEYVLNRKAVKKVGKGTLDAINFQEAPRFAIGGSIGEAIGNVASSAVGTLKGALGSLPKPDLPDWIAGVGSYLLAQVTDYITSGFQDKKFGHIVGGLQGPKGVGTYKGVPMANWVIEALQYAAGKGAAPQPTSGYRSHAQNVAEGRFYKSEHEGTQYPYGAVDFGSPTSGFAAKMSVVNATRDFKYPLLAPIGFHDDGHASGTGHQLGGLIALAKGGAPTATASKTGFQKYISRARHFALDAWNALDRPNAPKPAIFFDSNRSTMSTEVGSNRIHIPPSLAAALQRDGSDSPFDDKWRGALIHEFAHTMQKDAVLNSLPEAEGGATWFRQLVAPDVYRKLGVPFHNAPPGYPLYTRFVKKRHDRDWALKGQFKDFTGRDNLMAVPSRRRRPKHPKHRHPLLPPWYEPPIWASNFLMAAPSIIKGKVSWFRGGATAGGSNTAHPGIALNLNPGTESGWNNNVTQSWMEQSKAGHPVFASVAIGSHKANLPIIDLGPAASTGRAIDVTQGGVGKLGFDTSNFPTDTFGTATILGGGATNAGKAETVPTTFHGVRTKALDFPPVPKTLKGVKREIGRRTAELKRYRAAVKAAEGKPKIKQALEQNVTHLEGWLRQLHRQAALLRREKTRRRLKRKLGRQLGKLLGFEREIDSKSRAYEIASQMAEQIVDLEPLPTEPPAGATEKQREEIERTYIAQLGSYVNERERPAYEAVMGRLTDWRNVILRGEGSATGLEYGWEGSIRKVDHEIDLINELTARVTRQVREWRADHPNADHLPKGLRDAVQEMHSQRARLPVLRFRDDELRKSLGEGRDIFWRGVKDPVMPPKPPLEGTGSFEDTLQEVQGVHWPDQHEILASLPVKREAGKFGGLIFDTQGVIEELELKLRETGIGGGGGTGEEQNTALAEVERQLREQAERGKRLAELQYGPLSEFLKHMPPFIGAFKTGGHIPGGVNQAYTAVVHGGETITPAGQHGGDTTFVLHLHGDMAGVVDSAMPGMVKEVDKRMGTRYRQIAYGPGGRKR